MSASPDCWVSVATSDSAQPEQPPVPPGAVLVWEASGDATGAPRAAAVCMESTAQRARGPSIAPRRWVGPACWAPFSAQPPTATGLSLGPLVTQQPAFTVAADPPH